MGAPAGPAVFRTYSVSKHQTFNCNIWEAARATSAAPLYFKSIKIGPEGAKAEYIDGGVGYNNPVDQVVEEAELAFGKDRKVAALISIGTGLGKAIVYKSPGMLESKFRKHLAQRLGDLATNADTIAERASKRYRDAAPLYWRLNVDRGLDGISLEEWTELGEVEG